MASMWPPGLTRGSDQPASFPRGAYGPGGYDVDKPEGGFDLAFFGGGRG